MAVFLPKAILTFYDCNLEKRGVWTNLDWKKLPRPTENIPQNKPLPRVPISHQYILMESRSGSHFPT